MMKQESEEALFIRLRRLLIIVAVQTDGGIN